MNETVQNNDAWEAIKTVFSTDWNLKLVNYIGSDNSIGLFKEKREESLNELVKKGFLKVKQPSGVDSIAENKNIGRVGGIAVSSENQSYLFETPYFHGELRVNYHDQTAYPKDSLGIEFYGSISYKTLGKFLKRLGDYSLETKTNHSITIAEMFSLYLETSSTAKTDASFTDERDVFLRNLKEFRIRYEEQSLGTVNIMIKFLGKNFEGVYVEGTIKDVNPLKLNEFDNLFKIEEADLSDKKYVDKQ